MTKREDFVIVKFGCGKYGAKMAKHENFLDLGLILTDDWWPDHEDWLHKYCKSRFKWWVEYKIRCKIKRDNRLDGNNYKVLDHISDEEAKG